LISLIDYAIALRNVPMFTLLMFLLLRCVIKIGFMVKDKKTKLITGPWYAALKYVIDDTKNLHYDSIF
jgi:hypothetical protein